MSHLMLVEELKITLQEIHAATEQLGRLNQEAVILHTRLQDLQAVRQRIEVDLTTIKLGVL